MNVQITTTPCIFVLGRDWLSWPVASALWLASLACCPARGVDNIKQIVQLYAVRKYRCASKDNNGSVARLLQQASTRLSRPRRARSLPRLPPYRGRDGPVKALRLGLFSAVSLQLPISRALPLVVVWACLQSRQPTSRLRLAFLMRASSRLFAASPPSHIAELCAVVHTRRHTSAPKPRTASGELGRCSNLHVYETALQRSTHARVRAHDRPPSRSTATGYWKLVM